MTPEQACHYIGHEWREGANGPDEWDCWHFMRHILKTYFGRTLVHAPIGDIEACRNLYKEQMKSGMWERIQFPEHGCAVSMREGDWPHVGIYLDIDGGKILHCAEGWGVIATAPDALKVHSFGRIKYFRVHNV